MWCKFDIMKHLAIFKQPFLDLILNGEKTVESRFSRVKCAPFGRVSKGDTVLLKSVGGPVCGEFVVRQVRSISDATPEIIEGLKNFSREICSNKDESFWSDRKDSKYVTLIWVGSPRKYAHPYPFVKKDRRGWVVLGADY